MASVIVIDDEIDLVETISTYLEMYGIDVKGQGYNGAILGKPFYLNELKSQINKILKSFPKKEKNEKL